MTKADVSSAQEHGKEGKGGKIFIDTLILPPCLVPSCRRKSVGQNDPLILTATQAESNDNFCHLMWCGSKQPTPIFTDNHAKCL